MSRQIFEYEPTLAFRFIPNLKARIPHESGGYLIRTNSSGFRCEHEFASPRNPEKKRLLLFGDSFTAGDGVSNSQRYGDKLEKLLEIEVFNFGLPGTGTDQHYLAFKEYAVGLEADLTIIAVLVENIRRTSARYRRFTDEQGRNCCYGKPYFGLSGGRLELRGVPAPRDPITEDQLSLEEREHVDRGGRFATLRKIVNQVGLRDLVQKISGYQPYPEYDDPEDPNWRLLRAILEEFIAVVPKPVIIMPIPLYHHVEGTVDAENYEARFRELASANPCELHSPLPDLLKYSAEQRRAFRFAQDLHPTPAWHDAIALSLAPIVANLLRLPVKSPTS